VRDQCDKTAAQLRESMSQLRERYSKVMSGVPKSDWNTPENNKKWQTRYQEMRESPAYKKLSEDYQHLEKDLNEFVSKGNSQRDSPDQPHGYVWLFRRK
jgi:hypothetical protein